MRPIIVHDASIDGDFRGYRTSCRTINSCPRAIRAYRRCSGLRRASRDEPLLEALKKAELAKQAAKEEPPAPATPPFTRDKLPDITQPMEIRSDDLSLAESAPAPKRADKPVLELALEEPFQAAPAAPPPAARGTSETDYMPPSESMDRKQAQQVFEAKELDVNPRKPFYITMGALGLFALGTVGYFWYQLQPHNNYKLPPPSAQPSAPPVCRGACARARRSHGSHSDAADWH